MSPVKASLSNQLPTSNDRTNDGQIVTPAEWRADRIALLEKEKAHTRATDALAAERRSLPIVEVEKPYLFTSLDTSGKEVTLSMPDLFEGRRQLIIYHFMFDPADEAGCVGCSLTGDYLGPLEHLNASDTTIACVSRAPIAKIEAYKKRMCWKFPWVSSHGSDFNYDFHATHDSDITPLSVNFRTEQELKEQGKSVDCKGETHGLSCFIQGNGTDAGEKGKVYHTYSGYARSVEPVNGYFGWLDFTLLGRQDGKKVNPPAFARRDEYTAEELNRCDW